MYTTMTYHSLWCQKSKKTATTVKKVTEYQIGCLLGILHPRVRQAIQHRSAMRAMCLANRPKIWSMSSWVCPALKKFSAATRNVVVASHWPRKTGSGGCFYSPGTCCLPAYSGGVYLQDCHQVCAESLDQGVFWSREFWGGRYYISIIKYYESHSKWQSTCEINHSFHWLVGGWWSLAKSCQKKWHGHNLHSKIASSLKKTNKLTIQGISPRWKSKQRNSPPQNETWMQQTSRL